MALRTRFAAVTAKIESTPGTFDAPSGSTDGILVERPTYRLDPQNTQTEEVTGSLDPSAPIVGGMQCQIDFSFYVKGSGTPGVAPNFGKILKACGLAETVTLNTISGTGIAVADSNTITDSGNGFGPLTVGTVIYISGFSTAANNGEFIVTVTAAGSIDVTKLDGSAPGLTAEAAGATISIRYGVAAVAATAGITTGFTAQSPWAGTLQLYRGMPVWLSGNPATPDLTVINDYTAARVARIVKTMGSALTTSTKVSIPANVRYQPTSASLPKASLEVYLDGLRWRFQGCVGTARLECAAGGPWKVTVSMRGLFVTKTDTAVATPTYDGTRPGIWRASRFAIDRVTAGLRNYSLDMQNAIEFAGNPNATEGFDSPDIVARNIMMRADPYTTLVATRDLFDKVRTSTNVMVDAALLGNSGVTAGNRAHLLNPDVALLRDDPGNDGNFSTEAIEGFCNGADAGFMLALS